jgi:hypothetical protein
VTGSPLGKLIIKKGFWQKQLTSSEWKDVSKAWNDLNTQMFFKDYLCDYHQISDLLIGRSKASKMKHFLIKKMIFFVMQDCKLKHNL